MNQPVSTLDSAGKRVWIWELAPGIERSNFFALLGAAFFSIGLLTLVGNLRGYLFNEMLLVPDSIQGQLTGLLDTVSEIPALLLSGVVGAASDKIGRRAIYGLGFAILAVGYFLFAFASLDWTLYAMVLLVACGASLVSAMLGTIIADYPTERSRGKLVGICFFLNGLGVATLVGLAAQMPKFFQGRGYNAVQAGQLSYWVVAGLCLIPLVIVARGLAAGPPVRTSVGQPLLATLRIGIAAAREPRVRLAYLSAAVSRASLSIVSAFFFLWMVRVGRDQGMSAAEAYSQGSKVFIAIQVSATFWAMIAISFIDRLDRVLAMALAAALACASYTTFGLVDDPFQPAMLFAAAFLGIGEMSGILASQALIGQVAPAEGRGAVIGAFTLCGSIGIVAAANIGGWLSDVWRPSAPYVVMGVTSGLLCIAAIYTWIRTREGAGIAVRA